MKKILSILGYIWALPITLSGLLLALITGSKLTKLEGEVFLFTTSEWFTKLFFKHFKVWAFTWGGVIIVRNDAPLTKKALAHELVHFKQAKIFGIFLPVMYGIGSLIALIKRKNPYFDNFLEVWARNESEE